MAQFFKKKEKKVVYTSEHGSVALLVQPQRQEYF